MSIIFERGDFLEFFDYERIIDKEVDIYEYESIINIEFRIQLYINTYEGYASLSLYYQNFNMPLFDIGIKNIEEIKFKKEKNITYLCFFKEDQEPFLYKDKALKEPFLVVQLKPQVSFRYRIE